jgi:ELWxxDGT repeat protein
VGQGGSFGDIDLEPWCSDGTAQGTLPLGDLNPGTDSSRPLSLTGIGNYLLFSALSPTLGRRIWRSDGTADGTIAFTAFDPGTSLVRDYLAEDLQGGMPDPPPLQHLGNVIYFPCTAGEGAVCLQDIRPGQEGITGTGFISFGTGPAIEALRVFPGGDVLMSCWTSAKGRELCRFRSGPRALDATFIDLAPGAASSSPDQITPAGDYIYFTADDGTHGRELWAVALTDVIDRVFHDGFE